MNSSYDYYKVFYYVAKYRNFTQAAAALFSNQPNVTRAIKNLEADLGCTLFLRSNRCVTLTPEGEKLLSHISIAMEHIDAAERELALDKSLQQGIISIGATEVALHCLLLPILKQFKKQYPGIHLRVANFSTPQALAALKDGLVDLAVVTTPMELQKNQKQTVLKNIKELPVCSSSYTELTGRELTIAELSEYPLISLGRETSTYKLYTEWFLSYGLTLTPDIEAATADQILPMVKNDLGIGFVPEEFLYNLKEDEKICRLNVKEMSPCRAISLVKCTDRPLSIAARELENLLTAN